MLQLYVMRITEQDTKYLGKLASVFVQERRAQLLRCKNMHTAMCSACGELMARVLVAEKLGKKPFELKYRKNQYGKPYIEDCRYQFNISHSGEWVFCGISTEAVGVDVEKIKSVNEKIAQRCFTKNEQERLMEIDGAEQRQQYFYMTWTLKEGYVKYIGEGMRIPFDSFEFNSEDGKLKLRKHLKQVQLEGQSDYPTVSTGIWKDTYVYSVVGEESLQDKDITEIKCLDLIAEL